MTVLRAEGVELVYTTGSSNKYWRGILAGPVVATHYGRIGSLGQITVHHLNGHTAAMMKHQDLVSQKLRKGYTRVIRSAPSFALPEALVTAAESTNSTGNGGLNPGLAYGLVAHYVQACLSQSGRIDADDPIYHLIATGVLTAHQISVAGLCGITPTDPSLPEQDFETLEVMAGLTALGGNLPNPADLQPC